MINKNDLVKNFKEKTFDEIKHINEFGNEYWCARELMIMLGYSKWGNFKKVIDKAKIACHSSKNTISNHFADAGQMSQSDPAQNDRKKTIIFLDMHAT